MHWFLIKPKSFTRRKLMILLNGWISTRDINFHIKFYFCHYFSCRLNSSTKLYINCTPNHRRNVGRRNNTSGNNLLVNISPINSPKSTSRSSSTNSTGDRLDTPPGSPLSQPYWKSRLNTLKNSFLGSPRQELHFSSS